MIKLSSWFFKVMKKFFDKELYKEFLKNVMPAIITSVVLGTFSIVDGLFIGNKIGDVGLAAINFAYPITALIQGIGFGIGLAASILISLYKGKEENDKIKKVLFNSYILLLMASFILFICFYFPLNNILILLGAKGDTLKEAYNYASMIIFATFFQVIGQGLAPILRAYNKNTYVMIAMSISFIFNIIFDYLFIYPLNMGLFGAALATDLSQVIVTILFIVYLLKKEYRVIFKFDLSIIKDLLLTSLSPFGIFFSPNLILIIVNLAAENYGGDAAVATYTAISYITFIVMRLIQGVSDGTQPLLSYYKGKRENEKKKAILSYSYFKTARLTILATLICIIFGGLLMNLFGLSEEAKALFPTALLYYSVPFIFYGFIRISMAYFYAQKKNFISSILVYLEPLFVLIVVLIFPNFMGIEGIWISAPISQILLSVIALIFLIIENKNAEFKGKYETINKE